MFFCVYWLHANRFPLFLLFSDDFFVVQVPSVEYDEVVTTLESLLLLDHHVGSFLFLLFVLCGIGCYKISYKMSYIYFSHKTFNCTLCLEFEDGDMDGEGD